MPDATAASRDLGNSIHVLRVDMTFSMNLLPHNNTGDL